MSVNVIRSTLDVSRLFLVCYTCQDRTERLQREQSLRRFFIAEVKAMPTKPKRPCRYGGCPHLTDNKSGYCEEHRILMQRHYEHFTRGYKQHERYGSGWRKLRDRYISAHPLCEDCLSVGKATTATLVHHVKPMADGGTHEESNLMSLCVSCHEKIHKRKKTAD